MKKKYLFVMLGTVLAIVLVFFASYNVTLHTITTNNYKARIDKMIDQISVYKFEASKAEVQGSTEKQYAVTYKLTFKIPADLTKDELTDVLKLSLQFNNKTKDLAASEAVESNQDYELVKSYTTGDMYSVTFTFPNQKLTAADADYLIKNRKADIRLLIYNGSDVSGKFKV